MIQAKVKNAAENQSLKQMRSVEVQSEARLLQRSGRPTVLLGRTQPNPGRNSLQVGVQEDVVKSEGAGTHAQSSRSITRFPDLNLGLSHSALAEFLVFEQKVMVFPRII